MFVVAVGFFKWLFFHVIFYNKGTIHDMFFISIATGTTVIFI